MFYGPRSICEALERGKGGRYKVIVLQSKKRAFKMGIKKVVKDVVGGSLRYGG